MITLDTSGLVALMNPSDKYHNDVVNILNADAGPYIVPMGIMAEITYILEQRVGSSFLLDFLRDVRVGAYTKDCGDKDISRIEDLVQRYEDLRLGFSDAAVIACAERTGGKVLTLDRRHFPVVARGELTITVLP